MGWILRYNGHEHDKQLAEVWMYIIHVLLSLIHHTNTKVKCKVFCPTHGRKNITFYLGLFISKVHTLGAFINLKLKVVFFFWKPLCIPGNVEFMSKIYYMIPLVYDFRPAWIGLFFLKDVIDQYGVDATRLAILGTVPPKANREWSEQGNTCTFVIIHI